MFVTPCVGVWIEITVIEYFFSIGTVTPCVGVWIEIPYFGAVSSPSIVTPCVGVWIEIYFWQYSCYNYIVTPCVGVWIEIILSGNIGGTIGSLPAWECGLKSLWSPSLCKFFVSLPAWECGLKLQDQKIDNLCLGHSLRGSVDWNFQFKSAFKPNKVTPCVGVWIEIQNVYLNDNETFVTPCVGVWIEIC